MEVHGLQGVDDQERILENGFDRTLGQRELPWGYEEWLLVYYEVAGVKSKGWPPEGL